MEEPFVPKIRFKNKNYSSLEMYLSGFLSMMKGFDLLCKGKAQTEADIGINPQK